MMIYKKLERMPYAQAEVIIEDGGIFLKSYNTIVASIVEGFFMVNGLYSMTTRKHLSAFAKEYANLYDFSIIKEIAEKENKGYNIKAQAITTFQLVGEGNNE